VSWWGLRAKINEGKKDCFPVALFLLALCVRVCVRVFYLRRTCSTRPFCCYGVRTGHGRWASSDGSHASRRSNSERRSDRIRLFGGGGALE